MSHAEGTCERCKNKFLQPDQEVDEALCLPCRVDVLLEGERSALAAAHADAARLRESLVEISELSCEYNKELFTIRYALMALDVAHGDDLRQHVAYNQLLSTAGFIGAKWTVVAVADQTLVYLTPDGRETTKHPEAVAYDDLKDAWAAKLRYDPEGRYGAEVELIKDLDAFRKQEDTW